MKSSCGRKSGRWYCARFESMTGGRKRMGTRDLLLTIEAERSNDGVMSLTPSFGELQLPYVVSSLHRDFLVR